LTKGRDKRQAAPTTEAFQKMTEQGEQRALSLDGRDGITILRQLVK
jgi:hypothetical protein